MTQTKTQVQRLLTPRSIAFFIAGFLTYQIFIAVWHLLLPIALVATGVVLLTRWMSSDRSR